MKKIPKNILKNGNSPIFDLNERSKEIFTLIVEDYVTNGEPVGSRKLSRSGFASKVGMGLYPLESSNRHE